MSVSDTEPIAGGPWGVWSVVGLQGGSPTPGNTGQK